MMSSSGHSHAFRLPVGVGYLGWRLDQAGDEAHLMLDASLQNGVRAIWLALGEDLGKWVDYIRQSDSMTGRRTLVFIQVNSLDEALTAVNEWKADVLVAQGKRLLRSYVFDFWRSFHLRHRHLQEMKPEDTGETTLRLCSLSFPRF